MPNPAIPTYVIDYPEAQAAARWICGNESDAIAGVFPALNADDRVWAAFNQRVRADARDLHPRPLPDTPFIVLNGSGDYHHETVPLVLGFLQARPEQTFSYIQIDAHPDKDEMYRWKLDCASFVGRIMEMKPIKTVTLLGLWPPALDVDQDGTNVNKMVNYYRCDYFKTLRQYNCADSHVNETLFRFYDHDLQAAHKNKSIRSLTEITAQYPVSDSTPDQLVPDPEAALQIVWKTVDEFDPNRNLSKKRPVYLSIDLDVCRDRPVTDWRRTEDDDPQMQWGVPCNEGNMSWEDLLALVRRVGAARPIAGADICGLTKDLDRLSPAAREDSLNAVSEIYDVLTDVMLHPPSLPAS